MKFENLVYKKFEQIETAEATKYRATFEKIEERRGLKISLRVETKDLEVIEQMGITLCSTCDAELTMPQTKLDTAPAKKEAPFDKEEKELNEIASFIKERKEKKKTKKKAAP